MDNDPLQIFTKATATLINMGYTLQRIPPRSPDLNPIENVYHLVRKQLEAHVKENNITYQRWEQFKEMVWYNIWSMSKDVIDKIISSVMKRLQEIVKL